jgi:hypothetical protein
MAINIVQRFLNNLKRLLLVALKAYSEISHDNLSLGMVYSYYFEEYMV